MVTQPEEAWSKEWKEICDQVATSGIPYGKWISDSILRKLTVAAPITMSFSFVCILVHLITLGGNLTFLTRMLSVQDQWDKYSLTQYTSLFTHVVTHNDYGHLRGNLTMLLLIGPNVEYYYGSYNVLGIIAIVSLVSAIVHTEIGRSNTHQLGASGVVFCFILLNSLGGTIRSNESGKIPLSFILTAALYLGEEFWLLIFPNRDSISHHAHLSGGLVGAAFGLYILQRRGQRKQTKTKRK